MLCNHGWEKQHTQRPKGSGPKRGQINKYKDENKRTIYTNLQKQ